MIKKQSMNNGMTHVGEALMAHANLRPKAIAFKIPQLHRTRISFKEITFAQFSERVQSLAHELRRAGIKPGNKTLVLVPMGEAFVRTVYALFLLGAVPVLIDPGLGRTKFLACVKNIAPDVLVGTSRALLIARLLAGRALRPVSIRYTVPCCPSAHASSFTEFHRAAPETLGAIVFTSGSTGAPKAVAYTRGEMQSQVSLLSATYGFGPEDTDLPLLSAFSLFNPALGSTTVVPSLDARRPAATLKPAELWQTMCLAGVTRSFGSPRLWGMLAQYAIDHRLVSCNMRQLHLAGAPVCASLVEHLMHIFPKATIHTPYGATEALPVSTLDGSTILSLNQNSEQSQSLGVCVGRVLDSMQVKIISPKEGPMGAEHLREELPASTLGEIVVEGPSVSRNYVGDKGATLRAKIYTPQGVWHRMGDIGYKDAQGRLWFCGRVVERVFRGGSYWDTEPTEAVFLQHPEVAQAALIGLGPKGDQTPAVVVSLNKRLLWPGNRLKLYRELAALAKADSYTKDIDTFFIVQRMPVDVRHNTKIHRLALARRLERRCCGLSNSISSPA